jgi:hypothetical protein
MTEGQRVKLEGLIEDYEIAIVTLAIEPYPKWADTHELKTKALKAITDHLDTIQGGGKMPGDKGATLDVTAPMARLLMKIDEGADHYGGYALEQFPRDARREIQKMIDGGLVITPQALYLTEKGDVAMTEHPAYHKELEHKALLKERGHR